MVKRPAPTAVKIEENMRKGQMYPMIPIRMPPASDEIVFAMTSGRVSTPDSNGVRSSEPWNQLRATYQLLGT